MSLSLSPPPNWNKWYKDKYLLLIQRCLEGQNPVKIGVDCRETVACSFKQHNWFTAGCISVYTATKQAVCPALSLCSVKDTLSAAPRCLPAICFHSWMYPQNQRIDTNYGTLKHIQESLWSRDLRDIWSVVSNTAADIIFLYMNPFKGIVWIVIDSNFKLSSHLKHKHVVHNQSKINEYKLNKYKEYNFNKLMPKFTCLWMIWIIIWWWKCTQTFKCTRSTCFPCAVNSVMLYILDGGWLVNKMQVFQWIITW